VKLLTDRQTYRQLKFRSKSKVIQSNKIWYTQNIIEINRTVITGV